MTKPLCFLKIFFLHFKLRSSDNKLEETKTNCYISTLFYCFIPRFNNLSYLGTFVLKEELKETVNLDLHMIRMI